MSDSKEKTPAAQPTQSTKATEQAAAPTPTTPEKAPRIVFSGESVTIQFESPITLGNGEQIIDQVVVTKPRAGAMRGMSMFEIMHMDTDTLIKLLPRITTPALHKAITDQLDPVDLGMIGKCITAFFGGKLAQETLEEQIEEMDRKVQK